jgi:hypothetical protein
MKKSFYPSLAFLALISTAFACALPFGNGQPSGDQVATIVAATLQALTPVSSVTETPTSQPTGLLPHTFYYLGNDSTGLLQVFRIEKDGKTVKQITFEPTTVGRYDVSLVEGSVAYVANNQLLLINADGSSRRLLVDGGPVDPNNPIENSLSNPVFSPDGQTIAYGYKGLNLYNITTGVSNRVLEKPVIDPVTGATRQGELYWPEKYSPDGVKLIITTGIPNSDAIFDAIYYPASKSIVRFNGEPGAFICCGEEEWTQDSLSFYAANPTVGMFGSGLWRVDAASGGVTTLLPTDAGGGNFNLADEPYFAPDGQLYFFFTTASSPDGMIQRSPLQLVRSAPDGVTGRTVLSSENFQLLNETLWAPDASLVIVAYAPTQEVYQGGQAEVVFLDGRPNIVLTTFAQQMKWGP